MLPVQRVGSSDTLLEGLKPLSVFMNDFSHPVIRGTHAVLCLMFMGAVAALTVYTASTLEPLRAGTVAWVTPDNNGLTVEGATLLFHAALAFLATTWFAATCMLHGFLSLRPTWRAAMSILSAIAFLPLVGFGALLWFSFVLQAMPPALGWAGAGLGTLALADFIWLLPPET